MRLFVVTAMLAAGLTMPALAQGQVCEALRSELAALRAGGGSEAELRRYDEALADQEQQLRLAEQEWAGAGCNTYQRSTSPICSDIEDALTRMDRNYDSISVEREAVARRQDSREAEAELEVAIVDAGCDQPQLPETVAVPPSPSEREQFRTVCVRACDGYFFPMSYGVAKGDFARDEQSCQATCPGTDMRLYVHRVPEQEASEMVAAVSGEPYSVLPTANRYREPNATMACGCGQGGATIAKQDKPPQSSIVAIPEPKPEADPQSASIVPDQPAQPKAAVVSPPAPVAPEAQPREMTEADRSVRTVGPRFLPDQEEAIDLRSPGRKSAP